MNFSNKIYTEKYVDKIKSNKFEQSNNINDKEYILNNKINHKTCNHLFDCILESNDHESLMEDRKIYISKKKTLFLIKTEQTTRFRQSIA